MQGDENRAGHDFHTGGAPVCALLPVLAILFGIICGLVAQQIPPIDALKLGVYLHGLAGDLARKKKSEYSLIASDLIDFLPQAFLELQG